MNLGARTAAWSSGGSSPLPSEYRQVLSLNASGNQCISFIPPNYQILSTYSFSITVAIPKNTNPRIFAASYGGVPKIYAGGGYHGGWNKLYVYSGGQTYFNRSYSDYEILRIKIGPQSAELFDESGRLLETISGISIAEFSGAVTAVNLFGFSGGYSVIKILNFQINDGDDVIVRHEPCVRKLDEKPGMYDVIGRMFFTNTQTGDDFTVTEMT